MTPSRPETKVLPTSRPGRQSHWYDFHAAQQPDWDDPQARDEICTQLAERPVLVSVDELRALRQELAAVAAGRSLVLQAGDCAESFAQSTPEHAAAKADTVATLADRLAADTGTAVVRIGRIAGQYAKPRSAPTELVGERELPSFRGHIVNDPAPEEDARRHRPQRLLQAYEASRTTARALRERPQRLWTSHEALILDYEVPLVRFDEAAADLFLGSTHLPWVGERTRQSDGAHVRLLADVVNPVGCKVSGSGPIEELLRVCERLDPDRTPGRLTLISRFGADHVARQLPDVASAVRAAGHPVVWLCDPMHGNTYRSRVGLKTRQLSVIQQEVRGFVTALRAAGVHPGGLHLEVSAQPVTECVGAEVADEEQLTTRYTTLCDPRLSPRQAAEVVRTFTEGL